MERAGKHHTPFILCLIACWTSATSCSRSLPINTLSDQGSIRNTSDAGVVASAGSSWTRPCWMCRTSDGGLLVSAGPLGERPARTASDAGLAVSTGVHSAGVRGERPGRTHRRAPRAERWASW